MSVCQLVTGITNAILDPLVALLFAGGLIVFIWGIVQFMYGLGSDEAKEKGKQHMLWGIIGMAIMLSAYAIINIIQNTFGIGAYPTC
jgi:hypothetical protein